MSMEKTPNVLFIASNIPTPLRESNPVILDIAGKLSHRYNISVLYPMEHVPFPLHMIKKYRHLHGLPSSWKHGGISVSTLKYFRLPGFKLSFSLIGMTGRKLFSYFNDKELPDMTHAHFALPDGYLAYLLYKRYGIPYIISVRKTDINYIESGLKSGFHKKKYERVICNATQVITHNEFQKNFIDKTYHIESLLIPHGIDPSFLEEKTLTKRKRTIVITVVGAMINTKHLDWVIQAVQEYNGDKELTLRIIGSGNLNDRLKEQAKNSKNIIFYGQQPHEKVGKLLYESDIFALPSVIETFGLVYLEAAAKMNAVIAVKNTGVWGLFKENEEMLFIDDYQTFKQKLFLLIEEDETRICLARNAFERTKNSYTWDRIIQQYHEIYRKALK